MYNFPSRSVKCTKHNWKLDVSTMKYINPPDSFCQDELGKYHPHQYMCSAVTVIVGLLVYLFPISLEVWYTFCFDTVDIQSFFSIINTVHIVLINTVQPTFVET